MRPAKVVLLIVLAAISWPGLAAAQTAPPDSLRFQLILEHLRPVLLSTYSLHVSVSFGYRGQHIEAAQDYNCEIVHNRSKFNMQRDEVVGKFSGSQSLHAALPDGTALVLFGMNPCLWTTHPTFDAQNLELRPVRRPMGDVPFLSEGSVPFAADGSATAGIAGSAAVLGGPVSPWSLRIYDLADFAQLAEVTDLRIGAKFMFHDGFPSNTLASDIPILARAGEAESDYAVLFSVIMLDRKPDGKNDRNLVPDQSAPRDHWLLADGLPSGAAGHYADVSLDNEGRLIVDGRMRSPVSQVGFLASRAKGKIPWAPPTDMGGASWSVDFCMEGDCQLLQVPVVGGGGTDTAFYRLYHPITGRLAALVVMVDYLGRLLQ